MSATTTRHHPPLRKRVRVLERTHSLSPDIKALPLPDIKLKHTDDADDMPSPHLSDYESLSQSESSDEEPSSGSGSPGPQPRAQQDKVKPSRPAVNTAIPQVQEHRKERSPLSPNSRAWYEFDLAVVVALVSPIGNWLTGTDHVKNLMLTVLLIFYLHQIIEVPWALYQNARPRTRAPHVTAAAPDALQAALAASELHRLEMLFLFLASASPLAGAALLRYATEALLGPAAVSWFSTALFVLATGMRPWAHLVERLAQRTAVLQDAVHYPSTSEAQAHAASADAVHALEARVAQLEAAVERAHAKAAHTTDDVYEYVDDAVDAVEHALRAQERRWGRCADRVAEVEVSVGQLSRAATPQPPPRRKGRIAAVRGALVAELDGVKGALLAALPAFLAAPAPHALAASAAPALLLRERAGAAVRSAPGSGACTPLTTILEDEAAAAPLPCVQAPWTWTRLRLVSAPYALAVALAERLADIVTMPVRAVARLMFSSEY